MGSSMTVLRLMVAGTDTLDALAEITGKTKRQIVKYVQTLKRNGYVSVCDKLDEVLGTGARGYYTVTDAGAAFAARGEELKPGKAGARPRKKTVGLREKAWWHFRAHKFATLKELLSTHANGSEKAAEINLYKYIAALEHAGILKRCVHKQPAKQSRGWVVWRLENDIGVQAPVWRQRANEVYDPNSDLIFLIKKEGE